MLPDHSGDNSHQPADDNDIDESNPQVTVPRKGLEFLATYPKLKELSFEMTEKQFLDIARRQNLQPSQSADGASYSIALPDGLEVLVMFGIDGDVDHGQSDFDMKCSGIQRLGVMSSKQSPTMRTHNGFPGPDPESTKVEKREAD